MNSNIRDILTSINFILSVLIAFFYVSFLSFSGAGLSALPILAIFTIIILANLVIYIICIYLRFKNNNLFEKKDRFLVLFTTLIFILSIIFMSMYFVEV